MKYVKQLDPKYVSLVDKVFQKHKLPTTRRHDTWNDKIVEDHKAVMGLYIAWAAYARGGSEKYVCDSDNGPEPLKEILNSVDYLANDEELIVTLNKALDVVHFRSDLASAFIEGGQ